MILKIKYLCEKLEKESITRRDEIYNELIKNDMKSKNAEMKISLDFKELELNHLKKQYDNLQNDIKEIILILEKDIHLTKSILMKKSEDFKKCYKFY